MSNVCSTLTPVIPSVRLLEHECQELAMSRPSLYGSSRPIPVGRHFLID